MLSFLFYLITTGQHSFWLDSAEFVTVARNAGLAHPPGTPLYVLLSSLSMLFPVGGAAFRTHLLNAVFGAACASLLFAIGRHLLRHLLYDRGGIPPVADPEGRALARTRRALPGTIALVLVALAAAISPAIWFQSVRAEVYALNSAICLGMVLLSLKWSEEPASKRYLMLLALLSGLGLANHHFLTGLTGAACLAYLLLFPEVRRQLVSSRLVWGVMFGFLGLLTYVYLPLRAPHGWLMWGDPTTPGGFYAMLSAKAFHISITEMPRAPFLVALLTIFEKWIDLAGPPLFLAGFLGLAALLVKDRRKGVLVLALILAGGVSKAIMYLDTENPDDHAYYMVGLHGLFLGSLGLLALPGLLKGILRLTERRRIAADWSAALLLAGAAVASGYMLYHGNVGWCRLTNFTGPDLVNRHFHEKAPPDSVFMPSYYASYFNHLYYREVERRRPDVAMVHQSLYSRFDGGEGYCRDIAARHPDLVPAVDEFLETRGFPLAALEKVAEEREILLENDTLEVTGDDEELAAFSLGSGGLPLAADSLLFAGPGVLLDHPTRPPRSEAWDQKMFWTALYRDLDGTGLIHQELAKLLVWYHYRNALYFINRGKNRLALLEVQLARQLEPDFSRLFDLEVFLDRSISHGVDGAVPL